MISGDDGGSATSASRAESPSGCPSWTLLRSGDDAEDNCQLFLSQLRSNYQAELKHEMSTTGKEEEDERNRNLFENNVTRVS